MSDVKEQDPDEKYQQQVLFTQTDDEAEAQITSLNKQVIIAHDDWQEDEDSPDMELVSQENVTVGNDDLGSGKTHWLWRGIAILFVSLVGIEAFDYFATGFIDSPITTSIVALITMALMMIASATLLKELSGLRQFKQRQKVKTHAAELLRTKLKNEKTTITCNESMKLCEKINASLPCDIQFEPSSTWQQSIESEHNGEEILQLYSRTVLSKVDEKAINEIAKFSTESVVLVALSPVALIDMLIMLWRNLRMIDKVAGLYGLQLGYWSRIKLIKQVFVNMAYAGASEMITDVGADMLGADLLGKVSGRLAQGLGAGMLTARLGLRVLKLARPISFDCPQLSKDEPKVALIRQAVIKQVTTLMKNKR